MYYSFSSTLEEILNSALIIHVVDISCQFYSTQIDVTKNVLKEIGVKDIKEIYLLNKADKSNVPSFFLEGESIPFSNKTGLNTDKLIEIIQDKVIDYSNTLLDLNVSLSDGKTISLIEGYGIIKAKLYSNDYIYYKAYIPNTYINDVRKYIVY